MLTILQQSFSVPFRYPVAFTENLFATSQPLFVETFPEGQLARVFFVLDSGVVAHHPELISQIKVYVAAQSSRLALVGEPLVVAGGEACKNNPEAYQQVVEATNSFGIDRHSYLVALGGGAVLDMVGFAAAISHRGIRLVRIPTTVLSQNDSAVGVKNSINAFGKKNYLGTFTPPFAVLNDFTFLESLEDRDWRSGVSEAVKVALIKDLDFFEWLEKEAAALARREMEPMKTHIIRSAQHHMTHIAGADPFEFGSSRPLDFGHWAAHKLEKLSDFRIRHGEAVAIGIALDSAYSYLQGRIDKADLIRIFKLFHTLGLALYASELHEEALLQGLKEFQEHLGGRLTIMVLDKLGKGVEVHEMDPELIGKALQLLQFWEEQKTI
ncbi:MAG: 3-dehydroquinate synthase [Algoriphagus sp.]|jgi:3-dehydroquinate synthase|uniref:3-dehydroquinate synthase n=1 Tax=Algoriphagus sp. TaxID=1872435 RepID=UPI0027713DA1|nr:3-dehydroquinate synthase [Algoriphagus sp.]MDP4747017.1 3-dehydroquinate synthase [Algoriphagus sp.]MDP4839136.1 3-dehydroquinate synthase [Algoriphagus sp.]MDP4903802.1 3-dehydroquinate synthase [Algoriphagus sp.]MDP4958089.1 3-dehydroquinate synthase [Algoriphagus sp.]